MSWYPASHVMRRDAIRQQERELRRAAEEARLVGPLRRPRRRPAA